MGVMVPVSVVMMMVMGDRPHPGENQAQVPVSPVRRWTPESPGVHGNPAASSTASPLGKYTSPWCEGLTQGDPIPLHVSCIESCGRYPLTPAGVLATARVFVYAAFLQNRSRLLLLLMLLMLLLLLLKQDGAVLLTMMSASREENAASSSLAASLASQRLHLKPLAELSLQIATASLTLHHKAPDSQFGTWLLRPLLECSFAIDDTCFAQTSPVESCPTHVTNSWL